MMPATTEPCFESFLPGSSSLARNIDAPMWRRNTPPTRPMAANTVSFLNMASSPKNMAMISGISTMAWPTAILIPARPSSRPRWTAVANIGPGISAPDIEMNATMARNSSGSEVASMFLSTTAGYLVMTSAPDLFHDALVADQ